MIKVIAFDLVGVLVRENDYELNELESKIERLFGPNKSDEDFLNIVKNNIIDSSNDEIITLTKHIIHSIYDARISLEDLTEFKNKHNNITLVVATNHVSLVKDYILNTFNNVFDNIYISSNINEIKPNKEFYNKLLQDLKILPNEMLFLDDSLNNIQGANDCGIHTIHVTKETNILNEIMNVI